MLDAQLNDELDSSESGSFPSGRRFTQLRIHQSRGRVPLYDNFGFLSDAVKMQNIPVIYSL